jgi:hypothetical protein
VERDPAIAQHRAHLPAVRGPVTADELDRL